MRRLFAALLVLLAYSESAAAQSRSGHTHYGPPQTITCLQAGRIALQFPVAMALDYTWSPSSILFEFSEYDLNNPRKSIRLNPHSITCFVEMAGQASFPIVKQSPR